MATSFAVQVFLLERLQMDLISCFAITVTAIIAVPLPFYLDPFTSFEMIHLPGQEKLVVLDRLNHAFFIYFPYFFIFAVKSCQ